MKRRQNFGRRVHLGTTGLLLLTFLLAPTGCFEDRALQRYYGVVVVRPVQQFRWIDGGLPQIFDPAFAAAPPDTDAVRALFEGLTEYDPRTLTTVPAVATHWESSNDGRTWTFYLREDARWSNGEAVLAKDFVNSWQRTMKIGHLAPHTNLLGNIQGANIAASVVPTPPPNGRQVRQKESVSRGVAEDRRFGAEAVAPRVLRVDLQRPDLNFPSLVAHPVFRPVKLTPEDAQGRGKLDPLSLISNGAFHLAKSEGDRVTLTRADHYWGKREVNLERVEFVEAKNSEAALAAYRAGEVDAVTNAAFEPLALKLLAPYQDFRRQTYGALTYYSFNTSNAPFDDVRVREALAIAIDRDRLSQDDLGGATEPAKKFLPEALSGKRAVVAKAELLERDIERATQLLADAGFPDGDNFPRIRLLVNRNEQQRIVAQAIAAMWKAVLNIETEVIIKPWDEYEAVIRSGEYDVVRRGLVMQTTDEATNLRMIFEQDTRPAGPVPAVKPTNGPASEASNTAVARPAEANSRTSIQSEAQALSELRAIPLYFASSYALVKPYVTGFETNVLDAPSLKRVQIDSGWKPPPGGR